MALHLSTGDAPPTFLNANALHKSLCRSIRDARFRVEKEAADSELEVLRGKVLELLREGERLEVPRYSEELLLFLVEKIDMCLYMTLDQFRKACQGIVCQVDARRLALPSPAERALLLKLLFTLTRCSRLLPPSLRMSHKWGRHEPTKVVFHSEQSVFQNWTFHEDPEPVHPRNRAQALQGSHHGTLRLKGKAKQWISRIRDDIEVWVKSLVKINRQKDLDRRRHFSSSLNLRKCIGRLSGTRFKSIAAIDASLTVLARKLEEEAISRGEKDDAQVLNALASLSRQAAAKQVGTAKVTAISKSTEDPLVRKACKLLVDLLKRKDELSVKRRSKSAKAASGFALGALDHRDKPDEVCPERLSIEHFHILKEISHGSYAKVFLARRKDTGSIHAVKAMKKNYLAQKNATWMAKNERDILSTVSNPFVVKMDYSFTSESNLFIVMEYLPGGDLYSLLKAVGRIDQGTAVKIFSEIVLALEYIHDALGIVHKDLKPDNVLFCSDGHVKLTDFGLSQVGMLFRSNSIATAGPTYGTPDYISPEVILGGFQGTTIDWWAFGVMLYECLVGSPPFSADKPEEIFHKIVGEESLDWTGGEASGGGMHEARDIIERLLRQNPSLRLGARGAFEVKAHPFFRGVDWDGLSKQKTAFEPVLEDDSDTSYFASKEGQGAACVDEYDLLKSSVDGDNSLRNFCEHDFQNFSFKNTA